MAGNAHANRQRRRQTIKHRAECLFCKMRPPEGRASHLFKNSTGHRHNPAAGKKQKKVRRLGNLLARLK